MKKRTLAAVLGLSIALLAGCGSQEEKNRIPPPIKKVETTAASTYAPFSGEAVEEKPTLRPIIVTVNNHPDARPQSGLNAADIIYEMVAEGNTTRLLALFESEMPKQVGPVRSARAYFVDLAKGYNAFYIAHGFSPEAKQMLRDNVVDNVNGMDHDGTLFHRSYDRVAPHNSYITEDNIKKAAAINGADLTYDGRTYHEFYKPKEKALEGTPAMNVSINFGGGIPFNSSYSYDETRGSYIRSSNGYNTTDLLDGEAVELANVLVYEMQHTTIDSEGRQAIDLHTGGNARVYQQGMVRDVRWKLRNGIPVAVEQDGSYVKLVPGKTWINFVSTTPGLATAVTNY
ncbi:hypothetical protein CH76_08715 [Lysinibacillus sp. BF-4]|uniref:DUF3048 domain-containing protein n=1 Tax=Lysinibacillus sp. BF-4 TaxID=1473546 RepID=UPI0005070DE1|nr:DUF3048 domain-containing protein [Lysinibacillus sp. BF-4]KFL43075.1 hypothetical protein CH76_08715 [Lysinibacillus sp. BF-4]